MDPDPGGSYCISSAFLKPLLLTVTFSTFYQINSESERIPSVYSKNNYREVIEEPVFNTALKNSIYLTFDDGPNKGTKNVSRILTIEKVPATLFLVGQHVYGSNKQRTLFQELKNNPLFEIANHSFTHAGGKGYSDFYKLPDSTLKDFNRCADSLMLFSNIIRTPGRNIWRLKNISSTDIKSSAAAADTLYNAGYKLAGWDMEWYTSHEQTVQTPCELMYQVDSMINNHKTKLCGHLVLLAHDQAFSSPSDSLALHDFINRVKLKDQYVFKMISEYPAIQ